MASLDRWRITNPRGTIELTAPATFDIASLLVEQGLLAHPFVGDQEIQAQGLGSEEWHCESTFRVDSLGDEPSSLKRTWIHLPLVDTLARVFVNDTEIGTTESAFHPWDFEITDLLKIGDNKVHLTLLSPEKGAELRASQGKRPYPHSIFPVQSLHRNMIRKPQCHGGWDWGPSLMTSGIYQKVQIRSSVGWRGVDPQVLVVAPQKPEAPWIVRLCIHTETWQTGTQEQEVNLILSRSLASSVPQPVAQGSFLLSIDPTIPDHTLELEVESPDLWWPNGLGDQALYDLDLQLVGNSPSTDHLLFDPRWTLGFRDLRLKTEDDQYGRSFTFLVNGREFFAKGANWIPTDAFPSFQSSSRTTSLLTSARDAHMNMIRVWGGGQYENDEFYATCDRLGILVWQDFMFSCGTYSAEEKFLQEVATEVEYQVRRLGSHSCLALWCGNNENLGALTWYPEPIKHRDQYLVDYDRLYEGTVGRIVRSLDPTRVFWPSSPSGGSGDYSDGWHDDSKGDMHYWAVWHEGKPLDGYLDIIPRFCSEFGFQSFPTAEGISRAMPSTGDFQDTELAQPPRYGASPEDWNLTSSTVDFHQKNPRGNTIILENLVRYYRMPHSFEQTLYLSQVLQSRAFETAVDFWRSQAPRSMGALYWQLNDLWPVASWSSLEYPDKWKLTHYSAQDFFQPLRIALIHRMPQVVPGKPTESATSVKAVLLNDTGKVQVLRVLIRLISFSGEERVLLDETKTWGSEMALELGTYDPNTLGIDGRDWFIHSQVSKVGHSNEGSQGYRFFCAPKHARIQDPQLSWDIADESSSLLVGLRVKAPAFMVYLDTPGILGRWSAFGKVILPGQRWQAQFLERQGPWTSALKTPADRKLIAVWEGKEQEKPEILTKTSKIFDLWSSGH